MSGFEVHDDGSVEFDSTVTVPCSGCGGPLTFPLVAGSPERARELVREGKVVPWCHACSVAAEAESITAGASGEETEGERGET